MLNNTEYKSQNGAACTVSKNSAAGELAKTAERRLHRNFRQHRSAGQVSSGWRVTLW